MIEEEIFSNVTQLVLVWSNATGRWVLDKIKIESANEPKDVVLTPARLREEWEPRNEFVVVSEVRRCTDWKCIHRIVSQRLTAHEAHVRLENSNHGSEIGDGG